MIMELKRPLKKSFNPYSNGMKIELCHWQAVVQTKVSFNPYSNGMKIE